MMTHILLWLCTVAAAFPTETMFLRRDDDNDSDGHNGPHGRVLRYLGFLGLLPVFIVAAWIWYRRN